MSRENREKAVWRSLWPKTLLPTMHFCFWCRPAFDSTVCACECKNAEIQSVVLMKALGLSNISKMVHNDTLWCFLITFRWQINGDIFTVIKYWHCKQCKQANFSFNSYMSCISTIKIYMFNTTDWIEKNVIELLETHEQQQTEQHWDKCCIKLVSVVCFMLSEAIIHSTKHTVVNANHVHLCYEWSHI